MTVFWYFRRFSQRLGRAGKLLIYIAILLVNWGWLGLLSGTLYGARCRMGEVRYRKSYHLVKLFISNFYFLEPAQRNLNFFFRRPQRSPVFHSSLSLRISHNTMPITDMMIIQKIMSLIVILSLSLNLHLIDMHIRWLLLYNLQRILK